MSTHSPRILSLLVTTALGMSMGAAHARDVTSDILGAPPMSQVSYPETQVQPASTPTPAPAPAPVKAAAPMPVATPAAVAATPPAPSAAPQMVAEVQAAQPPVASGIHEMLAAAYASSPALRAGREELRQQYEEVAQAGANFRPSVSVEGGVTSVYSDTKPGGDDTFAARDVGVTATQYLYRGGRTLAEVDQQLRLSDAAQATYDGLVQNAFLNVITAAMDIQRDRLTIDLNEKNHEVLARQLEAAQRGFEVGELTRTDVAQAQARVSGAEANIVAARADYANSIARYMRYAGQAGDALLIDMTGIHFDAPASLEQALSVADVTHPDIRSAEQTEKAANHAVDVAAGALLPTVYMSAAATQAWDPTSILDESQSASLGVRASMPLYEGGATRSQIRQAKIGVYAQRDRVADTKRAVRQDVTSAWNDYEAAKVSIAAFEKQVEAAKLARDGAYKEREVGTRTVLDTLNADAELLDAQVGLVRAQRNAVVSAFALQAAMGNLTARKLGISAEGDDAAYLATARGNYFGTAADPLK
ncbi:MAG: TolC family outer membrane protein [Alphaproteobacteria bacterium]|nr:TolC family outer membrane protein [Alphaproteobacteria bacterium]